MQLTDPQRVPHDFKHSKNAYDYGVDEVVPNKQEYWRISLFFNRKKGISPEYFARHWHHVHGDLITGAKAYCENNILRYNQFHQTPEGREKVAELDYGDNVGYDAVTEFWVKDVKQFKAFTESKEFEAAAGDVQHFVDLRTGVKVMIGYDNLVYGEAVPGYGQDGVVGKDLEKL